MAACETCWTDSYAIARMQGRHQAEVYHELLETRAHEDVREASGEK